MSKFFNFRKFWQLIKKQRSLDQIGQLLNDIDKKEGSQLASYWRILSSQVHYNSINEYKSLLKKYLSQSIDIHEFILKFSKLFWKNSEIVDTFENDLERVVLFSLKYNLNQLDKDRLETLEEFDDLIDQIYDDCTIYEFEVEQGKEELKILKKEFQETMEWSFLEFQDFF